MPDVLSDDDLDVLAAEYVLGTLDFEERNGARALLEVDPAFREVVRIWEKRFGELHLMVEAVQPDPRLWAERIRPKVAILEQMPPAIPSDPLAPLDEADPPAREPAPAEPASAAAADAEAKVDETAATAPVTGEEPSPIEPSASAGLSASGEPPTPTAPPAPTEPVPELAGDDLQQRPSDRSEQGFVPPPPMVRRSPPVASPARRRSAAGWVATSLLTGIVAILLAGLIGAWRFFPERLPERLRANTVLNMPPATAPAPMPASPSGRPQPPAPFDE